MKKGFTLIELLMVVLIIGILASVALPQYNKSVERAKMTEAAVNLRAIASANQVYYMANGQYAGTNELDKLDVKIPGKLTSQIVNDTRIATKDFIYSPNGLGLEGLALAQRADNGVWRGNSVGYYLYIPRATPAKITCVPYSKTPAMEKQLCNELNQYGGL